MTRRSPFFLVLCTLLLAVTPWVQAQEAPAGPGAPIWRLGFFEFTQQTYRSDDSHPFYQMTGNARFKGGRGAIALNTIDNWVPVIDDDGHSELDGPVSRLLHALPPFSLEYIAPTGFLPSYGLMASYTNIWLTDTRAKTTTTGADPAYSTPLVRMRSHYYMASASLYPFGQPQPGNVDFFFGFGLAYVDTSFRTGYYAMPYNYAGTSAIYVTSRSRLDQSAGQMSFQRVGLTSSGDNFGFTLEFYLLDGSHVLGNPFATANLMTSSDYELAYNDRGTALPSSVSTEGAILRAAWTYTFF